MADLSKQHPGDVIEGAEVFAYHEVTQLEAMSLADVEHIWDLVPTEDRDYLTRRYRRSLKTHGISSDAQEISMAEQYLQRYAYEGLVPAGDQWVRICLSSFQLLSPTGTDTHPLITRWYQPFIRVTLQV
ncbi:MAG: hypothetical protein AAFR67_13420, partial [Chloroflexota bacterium]